ncbi:hypothetical protein Dole_0996 [Desulfosudis oleivorans Hxd3]|uniref:Uncharacterized protein n=1 Tax=Desulfosudis oleivorans (strain DSM 6200 / JCM 39069 / Hxd3) TaxID=96561 RepID=A8ZWJ8_DESOH|nr:hypothetical protein Dole_0996 [Desulfosudis oleivorans Hxd3]
MQFTLPLKYDSFRTSLLYLYNFLCSIGIMKPKNIRIQKFLNQLDLLQRKYPANANWQFINKKIKSQGFPATIMKNQDRGAMA